MKVIPFGDRIYITPVVQKGKFATTENIKLFEKWKVEAIGDEVKKVKVGQKFFLKGYAIEFHKDDDTGILYATVRESPQFISLQIP